MDEQHAEGQPDGDAEELLRRALLDPEAAAAVALRVHGPALADPVTVLVHRPGGLGPTKKLTLLFHAGRDRGTIQTYVANGGHGEGQTLGARDLLRVPVDLDLGETFTREEAQEAYEAQARTLRDALQAADTVLAIWAGPLADVAESEVDVLRSEEHTSELQS